MGSEQKKLLVNATISTASACRGSEPISLQSYAHYYYFIIGVICHLTKKMYISWSQSSIIRFISNLHIESKMFNKKCACQVKFSTCLESLRIFSSPIIRCYNRFFLYHPLPYYPLRIRPDPRILNKQDAVPKKIREIVCCSTNECQLTYFARHSGFIALFL